VIDLFKTGGGMITAKQENVRLLGSLPLEPAVVQNGDAGNMALLDNEDLPFTRAFVEIVDKIIETHKDKVAFPITGGDVTSRPVKKDANGRKTLVIPVAEGKLSPHFGHCEQFAFIETEKGEIKAHEMKTPPPHEPGVLPRWLYEQGADVVITGGMGDQAQQLLREKGIKVILGAPMDSPEALAHQFLSGSLVTGNNVCDH
jgi:ATP-binding protein involved in chromosome partitioning